MADHDKPVVTDNYADVPTEIIGARDDVETWNDSRRTAGTNLPDYAKRWNDSLKVVENWLTGAWAALVLAVAGGGTGATTAAGARTNLGAAAQADLDAHTGTGPSAHGGTSAATASTLMARDGLGRTKVGAPSASDDATRLQDLNDHAAVTAAHGATAAATASRIAMRDAAARMKAAAPAASDDVAIKQTVDDHAALGNAHGAVNVATGNTIPLRDIYGRVQVGEPTIASDAATKGYVDARTGAIAGNYKNLKVWNVENIIAITADKLIVESAAGALAIVSGVNTTVSLAAFGAGGLDTGSPAANTGYFIWAIYNGTSHYAVLSLSASAPTMPSGYTHKALVAWCTTDATASPFNIVDFTQIDDVYLWTTREKVVDNGGSSTTAVINLAAGGAKSYAVVPPNIARTIFGKVLATSAPGTFWYAPVTFGNGIPGDSSVSESLTLGGIGNTQSWVVQPVIESQKIYFQGDATSLDVWISGFTLKR